MKLTLPFLLLLTLSAGAQSFQQKKISIYKTFGGVVYEIDTLSISSRQVSMILRQNPEAYQEFKIAKTKSAISSVLGFSSGVLVAVPLVSAVAGGQPEWGLAAAGGALFLASIPFHISFKGHALNAIDIYNAKIPTAHQRVKPSFFFSGNSAGVQIRF